MARVLAIDQGTTSTKAFCLLDDGTLRPVGVRVHRQVLPHPGWVEHDAAGLLANIVELVAAAGPCDVLGLANQGETVVAWDARTKRPLHNAIVWQDDRARGDVERMHAAGVEELTLRRAGLPLDPYFSAGKLRWLLDNVCDAGALRREGRLRLGTSDAFFLDVLTGNCATDVSTASRTSLMNQRTLQWDAELCAAFGVPMECLPAIRPSTGDFGQAGGMRLVASVTDQQASLYGHGCRAGGELKITFGTGAFALGLTGSAPAAGGGLLPTCAWQIDGQAAQYALDGGIFSAGSAIDWARGIGLFADFSELEFEGPSAASRGLMFVPAQSGLGSPYWDRSARGLWIGLDLATTARDLCRAMLEGIALRAAQVVHNYGAAVGRVGRVSIDGGMSRNRFFSSFLAGAIGRPIAVAPIADMTAFGVAMLCRAAIGADAVQLDGWHTIAPAERIGEGVHAKFADAVERSRGWA